MVVTPRLLSRLQVGFIRKMPAVLEQPEGPAPCSTAAGHRLVKSESVLELVKYIYKFHDLVFNEIYLF